MKKTILLLTACLSGSLFAQEEIYKPPSDVLPNFMTEDEERIMGDYYNYYQFGSRGIETPPPGNIRCAAEWEEVQTLVITWTGQYNTIQSQIVDAAQEECRVLIACSDSNSVKNTLSNNGVPDVNLEFLEIPYNSIWIRDYGPNTMYTNDVDSLFVVDWIYNRPRPDDDVMPEAHAAWHNIPIYTTTQAPSDLVNTGGNWMSDGHGTAFASELVLDENDAGNPYFVTVKNETDVDNIMSDFMGITRYIKMPVLPYDAIHHIDMHMKLLDEETLLVSEYPAGVADGPQIEANIQYVLSNFNSMFGTPYEVVRITVPPSTGGNYPDNGGYYRTYANNVFINGTVLVPTYREEYDTTALRTLQEALPGYNIVGIDVDNSGENLIQLSGAIHCITHTIGVADPMLITHQPLDDTYDVSPYLVSAEVQHASGIASATMYWSLIAGGPYTSVTMTAGSGDTWSADIPGQIAGTTVYYYVEGVANNGKTQVRPIVAPDGYWAFDVLALNGINELSGVVLDEVFPNPASAITCIPVTAGAATEGTITLRDITGKVVQTIHDGTIPMGDSKYFFLAHEFASGSYLVVIETSNSTITKKVMIR
ncbi:MAG: agmatine deiminase family protein [Crocinitomicaceae bacterium]|nr:agmatine deiminase family protein [Crocinitomicaceae bacterium]